LRFLGISISLVSLIGCAAHKRNTAWDAHNTYIKIIQDQLKPTAPAVNCDKPNNWLEKYHCDLSATNPAPDAAKIARERNEILDKFVQLANSDYIRFEGQFNGYHSAIATLGDFASLALTGAGSVFDAAKELSAAATGVQGAQKSYEKNFYDSQTRFVITLKMEALRTDALTKIKSGELLPAICPEPKVDQTTAQCYTLEQGMNDVEDYFSAGTIHRALAEINKNSATQSTAAEKKLNELKNMPALNKTPQ
jgi:hypothetical protein